jgi:hypothetical protein
VARRVVSLLLIFLLITTVIGQGLASGQTPDASNDPPPGDVVDEDSDDSGAEEPPDPPVEEPAPPDEGDDDGEDVAPTDIPQEPDVEPTEPTSEEPVPTDIPADDTVPTIPVDDPESEPTADPTDEDTALPTETPTSTPEETPEPEPTERPANLDALNPIDVASGISLQPGESVNFTYSYLVTTSRVATTLTAGLTGETDGWTIALYVGNSEGGPGLEVTTVESGTTGAGGSFGVIVVVTAPAESSEPRSVAFWLSSSATPDDGSPEESGISANGPSVSLIDAGSATPTSTPTETPVPTPTTEPLVPFAPVVTCNPGGDEQAEWTLHLCDVAWETENVSTLQVRVGADAADWTVVVVSPTDATSPDALAASGAQLVLATDGEAFNSQFMVATRSGCGASATANLALELTATSTLPIPTDAEGNPVADVVATNVTEVATEAIAVQGRAAAATQVMLSSASFTPIDISDNRRSTEGTMHVSYSDAPVGCAWQITLAYGDLVGGDHEIPVANLEMVEVTGFDQAAISYDQGTFVITVSLELPDTIPEGSYATTITASIELLP